MLLFPTLMFAQASAPASKPDSSASAARSGSFPVMSTAAKNRARQLYGYYADGQSAPLFAALAPQMKKGGSATNFANAAKQLLQQLGREEKMLGENFAPDLGAKATVYARYSQFSKAKDPVMTLIAVDDQGQITNMQSRMTPPPPSSSFADYQDKTKLKLPFNDEWFVHQGGTAVYQNTNLYRDAERFALIFVPLKDGQAFSGDGTQNEQFYCFGQPVTAPADGTVTLIRGNFPDNLPGHSEDTMPGGNRVLISHGHGEYSLLLHLKQSSIKVKTGAKVKQGDVVGECGNSGNSPVAHLEYRLQNSSGRPLPMSLPAQFVDYIADGKPVASGEPVRGQFVRNGGEAPTAAVADKK
jgi:hypothetical protein